MIIGVVGTANSGKDTVAKYLVDQTGWPSFSLSDQLREIAKSRGLDTNNETLNKIAIELRNKHGNDYISTLGVEKYRGQNLIVTSLRNPAELEPFKQADNFVLISVDAPVMLRYQRALERARGNEADMTFQQFQAQEQVTRKGAATGQRIDDILPLADYTIENDSTLEQLHQNIDTVLAKIK